MNRWQHWYERAKAYGRFLLNEPTHELTRAQRALRYGIDLVHRCWIKMQRDDAEQMAAALTYRTIFGLVPVVVLALLVFRAFGGLETWGTQLQTQFYQYMGWDFSVAARQPVEVAPPGATITPPQGNEARSGAVGATPPSESQSNGDASAATQPATVEKQQVQKQAVNKILADLNRQVSQVSFTSIGLVGIVLLFWAALSLVVTAEQCFNRVFDCEVGRRWSMRVAIYWAAITLGPVLLMLSIWLTSQVTEWIDTLPAMIRGVFGGGVSGNLVDLLQSALNTLSYLAALVATWILLILLYVLLPNTRVKLRAAMIGAFVAAALWEIGKWAFGLYVENAVGYSALYGSLGLIPLFLLWIYVTWLIVLLGLELTYTLQTEPGDTWKDPRRNDQRVLLDPRWLIPLMAIVAERFRQGEAATLEDLAQKTGLPRRVTSRLVEQLRRAGMLRAVTGGGEVDQPHVLARPADQISLTALLKLGQQWALEQPARTATGLPGWPIIDQLAHAQDQAVQDLTLADALGPVERTAAGEPTPT